MRIEMLSSAAARPAPTPVAPAMPDAIEPQTTDPAPIPTPEPATPPRRLLQKLAAGHFNPVADLRLRMNHAGEIKTSGVELPAPPPDPGHGKAYQKCLAAYRAMGSPGERPANEPAPVEPVPVDALA